MCDQCAQLQKQLDRQAKLLKTAAKIIKKQKRQIDAVRQFSYNAAQEANKELCGLSRGGLPKGQYLHKKRYIEGVGWCATKVYNMVIYDWGTAFLEMLLRLQG